MRSLGVKPDTYTLNALLRACGAQRRPYRALAHLRILTKGAAQACCGPTTSSIPHPSPNPDPDPKPDPGPTPSPKPNPRPEPGPSPDPKPDPGPTPNQACRADSVTLTLLANCLGPSGLGLRAVREARYSVRAGTALDLGSRAALLRASAGVAIAEAPAAREAALWLWAAGDEATRAGQRRDDSCVRAMMRVLARAGDLEGARQVFESQPPPHSGAAWAEMLRLEQEHDRSGLVLGELGLAVDSEGVAVTTQGKLGTLRPPGWAEDGAEDGGGAGQQPGRTLPTVTPAGMEAALRGAQEALRRGEVGGEAGGAPPPGGT